MPFDCIDGKCISHEKGAFSDSSCNNECSTQNANTFFIASSIACAIVFVFLIITIIVIFKK